jgi:hypothetical protein
MRAPRLHVLPLAGCCAAMALPFFISGCSLFPTTRHLPVPKAPAIVQTVTPEQLVAQLDDHWNGFDNLTATVDIQATELKSAEGVEKAFPSAKSFIVIGKPRLLRVAGTYFGMPIFNMASNGDRFTLVIPPKNTAIEGTSAVTERSPNQLENLRPDFFFDAIAVRGLDPDDSFMVSSDSETIEDPAKKHLYFEPEYVLTVMRHKEGSRQLVPVRQVTFHRDDMRPYQQDLYDAQGNRTTVITYSSYTRFDAGEYPSKVVIERPIEGILLTLAVIRVQKNVKLPPDEFEVKIPEGTQVRHLK